MGLESRSETVPWDWIIAQAASRSSGVLTASVSTPGSARLARPVSVPAGDFQNRGDTEIGHGLHAQVPADRIADLVHQASKNIAAVVNDATIGVGEQTDARVVGRDGVGQLVEVTDGGCHVFGMECAGDLQRTDAASLGWVIGESDELGLRSRDDDLAGTVDVRGRQPLRRRR